MSSSEHSTTSDSDQSASEVEQIIIPNQKTFTKNPSNENLIGFDPSDSLEAEANKQLEHAISILTDFQKEVQKQNEISEENDQTVVDAHLPEILKGSGLKSKEIFELLEQLISESEFAQVTKVLTDFEKNSSGSGSGSTSSSSKKDKKSKNKQSSSSSNSIDQQ